MILDSVLDIFYPRRCPVCQDVVYPKGERVCPDCLKELSYVKDPYCLKCGKPLYESEREFCRDCAGKEREFDCGRSVYIYNDVIKNGIYNLKYGGRKEYAEFYGMEMAVRGRSFLKRVAPEALIPVPLHKKRLIKRGYNQAKLLADKMGELSGIPVISDLVIREKNTRAQKNLSEKDRQNNLKNAFKIVKNDVSLKTVMVVDDIYTTGSTMEAISQCLKESGVREVYYMVLSVAII
ncbi:MAG: ComF family protein [Lachnospiraceae bacterium]|nr:ComF family protein [Lachnospiraceae bacterium]